ncbi:hypothetical protein BDN70DRAFT_297202 [Pholiota conissans]|uniref:Uncharacterized protein n=1 Tax=Pholiota conissans TaxID=109636 RepID=A0A9P5YSI4_9AGAR|nr:hypothetical protein BDN70DRAFT_297202 [Pholiota conissans]
MTAKSSFTIVTHDETKKHVPKPTLSTSCLKPSNPLTPSHHLLYSDGDYQDSTRSGWPTSRGCGLGPLMKRVRRGIEIVCTYTRSIRRPRHHRASSCFVVQPIQPFRMESSRTTHDDSLMPSSHAVPLIDTRTISCSPRDLAAYLPATFGWHDAISIVT